MRVLADQSFSLSARIEHWPIAGTFTIARGSKREAIVIVVWLTKDGVTGRGEGVPYARYGETPAATLADLERVGGEINPESAIAQLTALSARNALDCAYWDWRAKRHGRSAFEMAGALPPQRVQTCYTLSLDTPYAMAAMARRVPQLGLLKLKLGGDGDQQRMRAVRAARPDARLIADANEAWPETQVLDLLHTAASLNFELIEQPLPANADHRLAAIVRPVPVCADEAAHDAAGVTALVGRYDAVNIKLDKTGGLTPALDMMTVARKHGLRVMVGCMVATSLSMAPALVLAADATWVDLDGPLLLASDRAEGLTITDGWIEPARADLWG